MIRKSIKRIVIGIAVGLGIWIIQGLLAQDTYAAVSSAGGVYESVQDFTNFYVAGTSSQLLINDDDYPSNGRQLFMTTITVYTSGTLQPNSSYMYSGSIPITRINAVTANISAGTPGALVCELLPNYIGASLPSDLSCMTDGATIYYSYRLTNITNNAINVSPYVEITSDGIGNNGYISIARSNTAPGSLTNFGFSYTDSGAWSSPQPAANYNVSAAMNNLAQLQQENVRLQQETVAVLEEQNRVAQETQDYLTDDTPPDIPDFTGLGGGGLGDPSASLTDAILGLPQKLLVVQPCGFTTGNPDPVLNIDPMTVLPQDCDFIGHIPLIGGGLKAIVTPLATIALVLPFGVFAFIKIRETIEKW